ncbi:MAG: HD domain-containing protein [Actinomycetota bacterium]|nr:HD domain-containing protein [Actinomycetota bacterium]
MEKRISSVAGHSIRVAMYAKLIAEEMGLPTAEMEDLQVASILHDIGKISLDKEILGVPIDQLPVDKMFEFMEHPVRGVELIESIKSLAHISASILHHHESFDGTGYPDGKRGEDIPIHSRIIAVANEFDRAAHQLIQKKLTTIMAVEKIKSKSATLLDPKVVAVLISAHETGKMTI